MVTKKAGPATAAAILKALKKYRADIESGRDAIDTQETLKGAVYVSGEYRAGVPKIDLAIPRLARVKLRELFETLRLGIGTPGPASKQEHRDDHITLVDGALAALGPPREQTTDWIECVDDRIYRSGGKTRSVNEVHDRILQAFLDLPGQLLTTAEIAEAGGITRDAVSSTMKRLGTQYQGAFALCIGRGGIKGLGYHVKVRMAKARRQPSAGKR